MEAPRVSSEPAPFRGLAHPSDPGCPLAEVGTYLGAGSSTAAAVLIGAAAVGAEARGGVRAGARAAARARGAASDARARAGGRAPAPRDGRGEVVAGAPGQGGSRPGCPRAQGAPAQARADSAHAAAPPGAV